MTWSPFQKFALSWNKLAWRVDVASNGCQSVQFCPKFAEYLNLSAPNAWCVNVYVPPETLSAEPS